MKNNPLSFITRYWLAGAAFIAFASLALSETLFDIMGTLVYLPVLVFGAGLSALAFIHCKFPNTIDADNHDGTFVAEWKQLSGKERVDRTLAVTIALFIGACLIAAALIK